MNIESKIISFLISLIVLLLVIIIFIFNKNIDSCNNNIDTSNNNIDSSNNNIDSSNNNIVYDNKLQLKNIILPLLKNLKLANVINDEINKKLKNYTIDENSLPPQTITTSDSNLGLIIDIDLKRIEGIKFDQIIFKHLNIELLDNNAEANIILEIKNLISIGEIKIRTKNKILNILQPKILIKPVYKINTVEFDIITSLKAYSSNTKDAKINLNNFNVNIKILDTDLDLLRLEEDSPLAKELDDENKLIEEIKNHLESNSRGIIKILVRSQKKFLENIAIKNLVPILEQKIKESINSQLENMDFRNINLQSIEDNKFD
ncbi:hypothetical protein CPAV1605_1315 [seawater metagenome]|uniref:Uncharacterized protein n=1 Tax=seawater metagenome TaxID=1561972 RepID=A0A5E8CJH1_9ZZZZ